MRRIIAVTFMVACTVVYGAGCQLVDIGTAVHRVCTEDMKCWNCHTMGNRICGHKHGSK